MRYIINYTLVNHIREGIRITYKSKKLHLHLLSLDEEATQISFFGPYEENRSASIRLCCVHRSLLGLDTL